MTASALSLLNALKPEILRQLCASLFGMQTSNLEKDQIIDRLSQSQAITIFTNLQL